MKVERYVPDLPDRNALTSASAVSTGTSPVPRIADDFVHRASLQRWADIVAKVPEERPGQGNSAIIESEWPVL